MNAEDAEARTRSQKKRVVYTLVLLAVWLTFTVVQWRIFGPGAAGSLLEALSAFALVNLNILILLLLLFLTFRNLAKLTLERRKGVLGSRLKTRLVLAFLATTVIPTVSLFLVSAGFLVRSIDGWFSTRVEKALESSMEVARSYYDAEKQSTMHSARVVAERVNALKAQGGHSDADLKELLESLRRRQRLLKVSLVNPDQSSVTAASGEVKEGVDLTQSAEALKKAFEGREGDLFIPGQDNDIVRALVPVSTSVKERPYAVVVADSLIPISSLGRLEEITRGVEEYRQVQHNLFAIKASYLFPLLLMALLIMFAATWFAFHLAKTITDPIGALADATQRVAGGDLDFEVEVTGHDEVSTLVTSFNLMTRDLKTGREKVEAAGSTLARTNAELEAWRKYMEAVMDKVSAGVVGIDAAGVVNTINPAALNMMRLTGQVVGTHYREVFPEEVVKAVREMSAHRPKSGEALKRQVMLGGDGMSLTVTLHLTPLVTGANQTLGTVLVLNDLTDLVKAERAHAWREVARRVAHEIKNPLTPIQLSAQRLRRRYGPLLETPDGEILDEATKTIVTQVEGLKHLVNEFSRFAKMPESCQVPASLNEIVEEALSLYRQAHPNVTFRVELDSTIPTASLDPGQIKRALINLVENAVNALAESEGPEVEITTIHEPDRQVMRLEVADNGPGLSPSAREHLFEPYFSTKKGGTGLGLAIVKSIVADHRGYVRAQDNKPQGTRFVIELPLPGA